MTNYKYSAKYEVRNNELFIISKENNYETEIRMPRLLKVVNGVAVADDTYTIEQIIHNKIKWLLSENIEIPFDYTIHTNFDNDEFIDLLTEQIP